LHSVHFVGSITHVKRLMLIAEFGHSNSQAPQLVHNSAMIL